MLDLNINTFFNFGKKHNLCDFDKKEYDDFIKFMKKVEIDLNECLNIFLEANETSYKELLRKGNNISKVISNKSDYEDFITVFSTAKSEIEKILYREEYNSIAKREITDNVYIVKRYISKNFNNKRSTKSKNMEAGKSLIILIVIFLLYIILIANR